MARLTEFHRQHVSHMELKKFQHEEPFVGGQLDSGLRRIYAVKNNFVMR
jgi:hypothetical protein